MVEPLQQLRKLLKDKGLSLTLARQTVFRALQDKEPQTMQELVAACRQIDRVSVYRTVGLFERMGIVKRLPIGWKYKLELSDAFHNHHHHLTCLHCGRIIPFDEDTALEDRLRSIAVSHNFKMQDHQLEIQGLCPNCKGRA